MSTSTSAPAAPERNTLGFILVTAFLNAMGIGLIGPVSAFLIGQYVTDPNSAAFYNGLLFTSYSFFQFIAVPALGALSDRYGRRPILLICLLGSAVGYLLLGWGGALWVLFAGRILDGITGGNLGVINAYIADVTAPQERTRYFGLLGAMFGLGFVAGPIIGTALAGFGPSAPVYFAAVITFINTAWGWFVMPETLTADKRRTTIALAQLNPFTQLVAIFQLKQVRWLLLAVFFASLVFAHLQSNLSVLGKDLLNATAQDVGIVFTIVGVVGVIVQGWLIRVLLKRFSEVSLCIVGLVLLAAGFAMLSLLPQFPNVWLLWSGAVVFAIGNGLTTPAVTGLISQAVSAQEQGRVQGGNQSVQAIARVIGPLLGSWLYISLGAESPYLIGAVMYLAVIGLIVLAIPEVNKAKAERQVATSAD